MRYRSAKKQKEYALRAPLVARLLEERPYCEACPVFAKHDGLTTYHHNRSRDIHELVRRSQGGSILDEDNLMAVCGKCHQRITEYRDGKDTLHNLGLWKPGWTLREND
jgi:5-methylcytosine-specific restriction endonuclease McrA